MKFFYKNQATRIKRRQWWQWQRQWQKQRQRHIPRQRQWRRRGQGLIEYLILVALMGVATIGVIRVLNQTVKSRFASAIYALQGKSKRVKTESVKEKDYKKSDLSDFMSGAGSKDKK